MKLLISIILTIITILIIAPHKQQHQISSNRLISKSDSRHATSPHLTSSSSMSTPTDNKEETPRMNHVEEAHHYIPQSQQFLSQHQGKLKMLLLVRNDLQMGKGKVAAQCAHASSGIIAKYLVPIHDMLLLGEDAIECEWLEDDRVFYTPLLDESDEDEDYDEDCDEDDEDAAMQAAIKLSLEEQPATTNNTTDAATTKPEDVPQPSCHNGEKPVDYELENPDKAHKVMLYSQLTPREIRKQKYNIDVPIQALMKYVIAQWIIRGQAKIAVKIDSDQQMSTILEDLRNEAIPYYEIYDAGHTQVAANTRTVTAVGPFPADLLDPILGKLKLL